MRSILKRRLRDLASEPYRATGRFHYQWARGKLGHDPLFFALIEHGVFPDGAHVLDLGCGRGLLAAWLLAAEQLRADGSWPASLTQPPRGLRFRGLEQVGQDVACGNRALQSVHGQRVRLQVGDICSAELGDVDAIALLDVLHYIPYAEQEQLLDRVRTALGGGGIFVTRVGDSGGGLRFALSQLVDRGIAFIRGYRTQHLWCRSRDAWVQALEARGFAVQACSMSSGTPFANVLLIARVA
ncbi:MAG: class I SAM-dependent methyltransferase [Rhodoferax sp.]